MAEQERGDRSEAGPDRDAAAGREPAQDPHEDERQGHVRNELADGEPPITARQSEGDQARERDADIEPRDGSRACGPHRPIKRTPGRRERRDDQGRDEEEQFPQPGVLVVIGCGSDGQQPAEGFTHAGDATTPGRSPERSNDAHQISLVNWRPAT